MKSINLKTKLRLSNLLMVTLPVLLILLVSFMVLGGFVMSFDIASVAANMTKTSSVVSVIQWQTITENVQAIVSQTSGDVAAEERFAGYIDTIDKTGAKMYILNETNQTMIYISKEEDKDTIESISEQILGKENMSVNNLYYTGEEGMIYKNRFQMENGDTAKIVVANEKGAKVGAPEDSIMARARNYLEKTLFFLVVFAFLAVALTMGVLSAVLMKSIMHPLEKLREGTKAVSQGKLDYEIEYQSNDILGDLVSDFKEMQSRLKEAKEENETYQENRKRVLMSIAHDLRTPLTSIKGYSSGLLDQIPNTEEKRNKYLKNIYSAACEIDEMADQMFLFTWLDMDSIPFHFEPVALDAYFINYQLEQELRLGKEEMTLTLQFDSAQSYVVKIDEFQFDRVMKNLLENSIKYKQEGAGEIHISLTREADMIQLSFLDNGQGVQRKEDLIRIFDSFYRTEESIENCIKGSGLGLSIAKQIIQFSGGEIWAEEIESGGLGIYIRLPAIDEEKQNETDSNH